MYFLDLKSCTHVSDSTSGERRHDPFALTEDNTEQRNACYETVIDRKDSKVNIFHIYTHSLQMLLLFGH